MPETIQTNIADAHKSPNGNIISSCTRRVGSDATIMLQIDKENRVNQQPQSQQHHTSNTTCDTSKTVNTTSIASYEHKDDSNTNYSPVSDMNSSFAKVRSIARSADRAPPSKSCLSTAKKASKKRSVVFHHLRQAAEYDGDIPTCQSLTPLPAQDIDTKRCGSDGEESDEEMRKMTKQNNAILAQWDDFDEEDEEEENLDAWEMHSASPEGESSSVESRLFPNGDDTSVVYSPLANQSQSFGSSNTRRRRRRKSSTSFHSSGSKRSRRTSRGRRDSGSFGKAGIGKSLLQFSDDDDDDKPEIRSSTDLYKLPSRKCMSEIFDNIQSMEYSLSSESNLPCSSHSTHESRDILNKNSEVDAVKTLLEEQNRDSFQPRNTYLNIYQKPEYEIVKSTAELLLDWREFHQIDDSEGNDAVKDTGKLNTTYSPSSAFLRGIDIIFMSLQKIRPINIDYLNKSSGMTSAAALCWSKQIQLLQQATDMLYGAIPEENDKNEDSDDYRISRKEMYCYAMDQLLFAINILNTDHSYEGMKCIINDKKAFETIVHSVVEEVQKEIRELELTLSNNVFSTLKEISDDIDILLKSENLITKPNTTLSKNSNENENELFIDAMLGKTYDILQITFEEVSVKRLLQQLRLQALLLSQETYRKQEKLILLHRILGFSVYDLQNDLIKIGVPHHNSSVETVMEWSIDENSVALVNAPNIYYTGVSGTYSGCPSTLFQHLLHRKVASISEEYPYWIVQADQANAQAGCSSRESILVCCDILSRMNIAVCEVSYLESLYECLIIHNENPIDSICLKILMQHEYRQLEVYFNYSSDDSRAILYSKASSVDIVLCEDTTNDVKIRVQNLINDVNELLQSVTLPSLKLICSIISDRFKK